MRKGNGNEFALTKDKNNVYNGKEVRKKHGSYSADYLIPDHDRTFDVQLWLASFAGGQKRHNWRTGCLSVVGNIVVCTAAFCRISYDERDEIPDLRHFLSGN